MDLKDLCNCISLPNEMKEKVLSISSGISDEKIKTIFDNLKNLSMWRESLDGIKEEFEEDCDGSKILTVMLLCALETHKE